METITFRVSQTSIEVVDGRVKRSRLNYTAPGLEIYLIGHVKVSRRNAVSHLAMEQCLARHIPLVALKKKGWL